MAASIRIDVSDALEGLQDVGERLERFKAAILRWAQMGLERFVLPKLRDATPVRTGRLRGARQFRRIPGGGSFYWGREGFYWQFQDGLQERHRQIVRDSLPDLIPWAVRNARREVGI